MLWNQYNSKTDTMQIMVILETKSNCWWAHDCDYPTLNLLSWLSSLLITILISFDNVISPVSPSGHGQLPLAQRLICCTSMWEARVGIPGVINVIIINVPLFIYHWEDSLCIVYNTDWLPGSFWFGYYISMVTINNSNFIDYAL